MIFFVSSFYFIVIAECTKLGKLSQLVNGKKSQSAKISYLEHDVNSITQQDNVSLTKESAMKAPVRVI